MLNWSLKVDNAVFEWCLNRDKTLERTILVNLTPGCRKETLNTAGRVIFMDRIEVAGWQEQVTSQGGRYKQPSLLVNWLVQSDSAVMTLMHGENQYSPCRRHVRRPVGEGHAEHPLLQGLPGIVAGDPKVVGPSHRHPADAGLFGLQGKVATAGPWTRNGETVSSTGRKNIKTHDGKGRLKFRIRYEIEMAQASLCQDQFLPEH